MGRYGAQFLNVTDSGITRLTIESSYPIPDQGDEWARIEQEDYETLGVPRLEAWNNKATQLAEASKKRGKGKGLNR